MIEYITEAIVLDKEGRGDVDTLVTLFTKDLGKVNAKAKSMRKITSKLASHTEPGSLGTYRLVTRSPLYGGKSLVQLVDGLKEKTLFRHFLFLESVAKLTLEYHEDPELWDFLREGVPDQEALMRVVGFTKDNATCANCGNTRTSAFFPTDQYFLCAPCSSKVPHNLLVYL